MNAATPTRHENRLARETSPYLLQHANNPVDWFPWGKEALERSRAENKPILLSIGYAACHWCHVMERESFENEDIAKLMNDHFVCIKVDREERPDLDDIYMAATVALSGHGGWPMTVFLAPDQRPFFAGTYFPPADKYGRPGFSTLLARIAELWETDRESLFEQAEQLTTHVREQARAARPGSVGAEEIAKAARELEAAFDPRFGGFGGAPKFPPSAASSLLLRHHRKSGSESSLRMVKATLDGMKNGGLYDHLGGGFARYSTDERWLVPHFEKMLYDNAQLARVYLEAYQVTADPEYRRVAAETLDYVAREMQDPSGGYYSATDADSEGVEGKYFVWTPEQLEGVLDDRAADFFCAYYDVTPQGNWEGASILNASRPPDEVARDLGVAPDELRRSLEESRAKLLAARGERVPPLLDDKTLASWNGLMLGAMAEGYRVLGDRRYLESAERAARFVLGTLRRPDGGLYRTARGGRAHLDGYLEDYAFVADGLIDLVEAGGPPALLDEARTLVERMLSDFRDPESGAFYFTAGSHEALISRTREGHDGAIPSANAAAARVLARLAHHLDREDLRDHALGAIRAYGRMIERSPRAFATTLSVVDFLLEGPVELVFAGSRDDPGTEALLAAVRRRFLPNRVVVHVDPSDATRASPSPLARGKGLVSARAALYICKNGTCAAPVTNAEAAGRALEESDAGNRAESARSLPGSILPGSATAEATRRFAERHRARFAPSAYRPFGTTGLTVSALGFGSYRIDDRVAEHRSALEKALSEGINLIDTSTNYGDGRSERLIGEALSELDRRKVVSREQVVVVTKIGYVQGQSLEHATEREARGEPYPEMVKYGDGIWHCMHPRWIDDQLTRSLERLQLERVDVCLIHNPEYFLADAAKRRVPVEEARAEFYRRLTAAFARLELEVNSGRIGSYGVSSNTVVEPAASADSTSLSLILEAATKAANGARHRLSTIELPMNLFEPGALLTHNTGEGSAETPLACAARHDVAVLVNRPLNASLETGLLRLAEPREFPAAPSMNAALESVRALEAEFQRKFAPRLSAPEGTPMKPSDLLKWGDRLSDLSVRVTSLEHWQEVEVRAVAPQISQIVNALDRGLSESMAEPWAEFRGRYLPAINALLVACRRRAADRSHARARAISAAIDPSLPQEWRSQPLSRKSMAVLLGDGAVTAVLVGMRRPVYVEDALAALRLDPPADAVPTLSAVRGIDMPR